MEIKRHLGRTNRLVKLAEREKERAELPFSVEKRSAREEKFVERRSKK